MKLFSCSFRLLPGVWFGVFAGLCELLFWIVVDFPGGNPVLDLLSILCAIFWGGYLGSSLILDAPHVSFKRILLTGIGVPTLALATALVLSIAGSSLELFAHGEVRDGLVRIVASVPVGIFASASALLVVFWLIWPVGIIGAWLLNVYARRFMSIPTGELGS
ncbi:MAG: hypothetical protein OEN50_05745 [Deltaproteobacteria bacterium]|nr:hypothetical protein [Deltaproteobacteria bacterium]